MLHTPNISFLCIAALLLYTMMMHTAQVKAGSPFSELDPIQRRFAKSWGVPPSQVPIQLLWYFPLFFNPQILFSEDLGHYWWFGT